MLKRFIRWLLSLLEGQQPVSSTPIQGPLDQDLLHPQDYDMFQPQERMIYHYWNGKDVISIDPLVLYRRIMEKRADLDVEMKVARSIAKEAPEFQQKLIIRLRGIFNVLPLDDGGLTETETLQLLDHFLIYCEVLKKSMNPSQTSPEETLPPSQPSSPPSEGKSSPTPSTPASGSTEKEPSSASDTPPPSVERSPPVPGTPDGNTGSP